MILNGYFVQWSGAWMSGGSAGGMMASNQIAYSGVVQPRPHGIVDESGHGLTVIRSDRRLNADEKPEPSGAVRAG